LRQAKFGIWVHFGSQSGGEVGDWYARIFYVQGARANKNNLSKFGHPSETGYKEELHDWNTPNLIPPNLPKYTGFRVQNT